MPVELTGEKRLAIAADVELPRLYVIWPTPPIFASGDAELDMLGMVASSGKSSRLYKRLVRDMQIAQDVSAYQASEQLSSTFWITVTMKKGHTPDEALKVVDEELGKLRDAAPSAEEIDRAKAQILSHLVFDAERVTGRANRFNEYNQLAGDPAYYEKDAARYQRLGAGDVQRVARDLLPAGKRVVAIVTPTPGAPRAGKLVGK